MNAFLREKQKEIENFELRSDRCADLDNVDADNLADGQGKDENKNLKSKRRLAICGLGSYRACRKNGIEGMVKLFGMTPEQYGENLSEGYSKYEVKQCNEDILEAARKFVSL